RHVGLEPASVLVAERAVLGRVIQIHRDASSPLARLGARSASARTATECPFVTRARPPGNAATQRARWRSVTAAPGGPSVGGIEERHGCGGALRAPGGSRSITAAAGRCERRGDRGASRLRRGAASAGGIEERHGCAGALPAPRGSRSITAAAGALRASGVGGAPGWRGGVGGAGGRRAAR